MIIPLSHDSGEVRRQPWVTYGIILSCALVFLVTNLLNREVSGKAERLVAAAHEYWKAHPYLEAAPRLTEITGDPGSAVREQFYAIWDETGEPPVPASSLEVEQQKFDELMEQAFAALEEHPWYRFGLIPSAPTATGLFAHMFLHGGWLHLLPNLLFLFLTGSFLEDRWGRGLFALFYLAAGVSGAVLFVSRYPSFDGPLIGASGAIAGAMGAFLVCFARTKIKFFYWLGFFFGTFSAPAWLMLPLWFANEVFTASLMDAINPGGSGAGVAYWAHVGGFGFGVVAALAIRYSGAEEQMAGSFDPVTALEAAQTALGAPGLEPVERGALEAIVAETRGQVEEAGIALGSPGYFEASPEAHEVLDYGAVDLIAISEDPEPRGLEAEPVADLELDEKEEPERFESAIRRTLRVMEAVPLELDEEAIWLEVEGRGRTRLPLSRVDAVAAVGVHGLSRRAVILIDLALDWTADGERPLRVLRLRSDQYDPRALVGDAASPLEAIGQLVSTLITRARALPLPDPDSARGQPFKIFRDLAGYEEQVLRADRPAVEDIF